MIIKDMTDLMNLTKPVLADVINQYNTYVLTFNDIHDSNDTPVSIFEFATNDYVSGANSFLEDDDKMYDYLILSKEEFLQSYSYLTEEDYDLTDTEFKEDKAYNLAELMRIAENAHLNELRGEKGEYDVSSEAWKSAISSHVARLTAEEFQDYKDYCNELAV